MRITLVLLFTVAFATLPFQALAADKPIQDVKELAGSWQGWVTAEVGDERATMIVQADGSYKASTIRGTTAEGKFYLLSEGQGKTVLRVMPADPTYGAGSAEYERIE